MADIVTPFESEADKVARHKAALSSALVAVVAAAEEARKDGFYIEFGVNLDGFGRYTIQPPPWADKEVLSMSIQEQAKAELDRAKFGAEDSAVMLDILGRFFKQWDSGGAVAVASQVLARLIAGQPLSPLTGADDEWIDRADINGGVPMWQNMRCSSVFKDANGICNDIDLPGDGLVTFPYDPATRAVEIPVYEVEVDRHG